MSKVQRDAVIMTLAEWLPKIKADAERRAPFETGKLRRSFITEISRLELGGKVFSIAPHSHLVEFGTVMMSARPFFRPALDENRKDILRTFYRELSRQWRKP